VLPLHYCLFRFSYLTMPARSNNTLKLNISLHGKDGRTDTGIVFWDFLQAIVPVMTNTSH
jgi:hypothetical protein